MEDHLDFIELDQEELAEPDLHSIVQRERKKFIIYPEADQKQSCKRTTDEVASSLGNSKVIGLR